MTATEERALDDAIQVAPLVLRDAAKRQKVEDLLEQMRFSAATVRKIQEIFVSEMEKGIHQQPSSLQMENTYIPELPDGTESGLFLALDLGGTYFRMILLELDMGRVVRETVQKYDISVELRIGSGIRLFDYLAACVSDFVINQGLQDVELPLGFTFSFPMNQHSLDVGVLTTWTKTFNCPDVVNKDAVKLLRDALDRRGDTKVIIDIEWGAFGDNGVLEFIKTDFDRENDANSLIINSFTFEKYIGGKFLGEVVRVVLKQLYEKGLLFESHNPTDLLTPGTLTSDLVSDVESDTVHGGFENTRKVLQKFGITTEEDDMKIVQYVCEVVSNRAALLISICLAALLERMNKKSATIAVDGSLYKHHPRLKGWMNQYISLLAPRHKFKLIGAEDGSGKGAALVAAIAMRLKKRLE
ncbi:hexokinase-1 isoform X2 [Cephus cinctus]|uniref:Phosphotransferase n=1 Tax=Cephus cinctus TaxID=211228 RepID=A0AAJ7VZD1_CEPCN|nr:hexokinase-1 isoform X2 [Cephus cinctus]